MYAHINLNNWKLTPLFKWIMSMGVPEKEMLKTFNCGIGLMLAVSPEDEEMALGTINQSSFFAKTIGTIDDNPMNDSSLNFV